MATHMSFLSPTVSDTAHCGAPGVRACGRGQTSTLAITMFKNFSVRLATCLSCVLVLLPFPLAQAQQTEALSSPAEAEVRKFYDEHPELFSNRRIYTYRALGIKAPSAEVTQAIKKMIVEKQSMEAIVVWAKSMDLQIGIDQNSKPAEQLPLQLLPAISKMSDGQILLVAGGGNAAGIEVFELQSSKAAPVDLNTATVAIQRFLLNPKAADFLKK